MLKKGLLILLIVLMVAGGIYYFLSFSKNKTPLEKSKPKSEQKCTFEIKEVYFEESDDPQSPLLKIKGIIGPLGFYKYKIHFPPQEKTSQGIGPIEVGKDTPCTEEKMCRPENPCQEFTTQDFIARSYPDNVPEFGIKYFAKISFYLNDKTEKTWEGEVDWKKPEQGEKKGAVPMGPQTTGTGQAVVSFDGKRYAFKKTGTSIFLWAWVDSKGNPTSSWLPLSEIPQGYGMTYPGYYLINRTVFADYVQVKKSGGGGGGWGLIQ